MKYPALFDTATLGSLTLDNRIVLPPLTRSRSSQPGNIANELMARYYSQRSGAGFMITEGTQIEPRGQGYAWTPGIHSPEQVEGWRKVTQAIHDQGKVIFAQLWHVGRVSHTSLQPGNAAPIAPSAGKAETVSVFIETGPGEGALAEPSHARALTTLEVKELVQLYKQAAVNAKEAGFDGIEIHSANGYLVNQFISDKSNFREDEYGGSLENRLRFLKEIVEAVTQVFSPERVGVRFAPMFETTQEDRIYLGLLEDDPHTTYVTAIKMLEQAKLGYLSLAEADWDNAPELPDSFRQAVRDSFSGLIIYAGRYTPERGQRVLEKNWGDLIAFGRPFIANPDLPERIRHDLPLNAVDPTTMYGGTELGYTDYPTVDMSQTN